MKVSISNIPPIENIEIKVNKLTVIVGMNNTGKSLFAHAIHALYNEDLNYSILVDFFKTDSKMESLYKDLIKRRTNEYLLEEKELLSIAINIMEYFKESSVAQQIYNFIFSSNNISSGIKISRDMNEDSAEDIKRLNHQFNYLSEEVGNKKHIKITKRKNSYILDYSISQESYVNNCKNGTILHNSIKLEFADFFARIFSKLSLFSKKTIVFPAERSGLTLMKEELNSFPNKMTECYVDFLREKIDISKKSEDKYFKIAEYIENNILFGSLNYDPNNNIYFKDYSNDNDNIYMNRVSSSVRELAAFTLYLKYSVKANETIIIDEPELSLHPDAVRYLARAIASLINEKLNIIVITHSDYFVKEINNLIQLQNVDFEKHKKIINDKFNNKIEKSMCLNHKDTSMFSFFRDANQIHKIEVECKEYGYIEPLFDNTISNMNNDEDIIADLLRLK